MVKFDVEPRCGMPQRAPESSMIYSVLMEELLLLAEAHLSVSDRPAGVKVPAAEDTQDMVERARDTSRQFLEGDLVYYNCAGDTYMLAATRVSTS